MNSIYHRTPVHFLLLVVYICVIALCSVAIARASSRNNVLLKTDADIKKLGKRLELVLPKIMKYGHIPGMVIGLIHKGELAWSHGFGVKNVKDSFPVTTRTVFEAASLSKPVFSYAVLKMADRGNIDLDRPLWEYAGRDYVKNDDRVRLITARMVLCHRSGFQIFHKSGFQSWPSHGREPKILFQPGEKFLYSSEAFVYLQRVVQYMTRLPLNEFMNKEVFKPLCMSNSSYIWRDSYDAQIAVGHKSDRELKKKRKWTKGCAAYTLYTTVEDYARFISAILNGTGLKQRTRNEMLSPQTRVPLNMQDLDSEKHPSLSWGLGVGLQNTQDGIAFWQWGDNGVFKCFFIAYIDKKAGVLYFTNSQNGLSVLDSVLHKTLGGSHPTIKWLEDSQNDRCWSISKSPRKVFRYLKKLYARLLVFFIRESPSEL